VINVLTSLVRSRVLFCLIIVLTFHFDDFYNLFGRNVRVHIGNVEGDKPKFVILWDVRKVLYKVWRILDIVRM